METAGVKYFLAAVLIAAFSGVSHAFGPVVTPSMNPAVFRSSIGIPATPNVLVQSVIQFASGLSNVKAYGSNNTAGNLLTLHVAANGASPPSVASIADTQLNTWTIATSSNFTPNNGNFVYFVKNCAGGANTVTVTLGAGSGASTIILSEFSGLNTVSPIVITSSNTFGSGNATTGVMTSTNSANLVLGFMQDTSGSNGVISAGSGYTIVQKDESGATDIRAALETLGVGTPAASGSYNPDFSNANVTWNALGVIFRQ